MMVGINTIYTNLSATGLLKWMIAKEVMKKTNL